MYYILIISGTFTQELNTSSYPLHLTRFCLILFLLRVRIILSIWDSVRGDKVDLTSSLLPILHERNFVNRLGHALNTVDNPKYFS